LPVNLPKFRQPYVDMLRLARTPWARLVVDTDQDLDAIARLCGLGNASYLIRMFRSVLGTTPGAYRRGLPSRLLAESS
jgi:AraC-like DNA-binding protein